MKRATTLVRIKAREHGARIHLSLPPTRRRRAGGWLGITPTCSISTISARSPARLHSAPRRFTRPLRPSLHWWICPFYTRMLDYHPQPIKVLGQPQRNLDSDGRCSDYVEQRISAAARGSKSASLTAHPQGIPHGPIRARSKPLRLRRTRPNWSSCATPSDRFSRPRPRDRSRRCQISGIVAAASISRAFQRQSVFERGDCSARIRRGRSRKEVHPAHVIKADANSQQ